MKKRSSQLVVPIPEHPLPLSALLSHALVAFTIEFDNEAQHRMPHRTTNYGASAGSVNAPWLVSMVMWTNCMQYIPATGITIGALYRKALVDRRCLRTILTGMRRWGYLVIDPEAGRKSTPKSKRIVRVTEPGRTAQATWQPLSQLIENRWQERFGADAITELRKALAALMQQFYCELPAGLPILEYGLFTRALEREQELELRNPADVPLAALFSKILMMFALEFDRKGEVGVSLAISANVLRILSKDGIRVRDLPGLSGVSKESIAMSLNFLVKGGSAKIEVGPNGRAKVARLTAEGLKAQDIYHRRTADIEERWEVHFGQQCIAGLRQCLQKLVGKATIETSPLFWGMIPYPDGWRAAVPIAKQLPHYPMVLHRGGFPDGS
jgi:hypothetical protein